MGLTIRIQILSKGALFVIISVLLPISVVSETHFMDEFEQIKAEFEKEFETFAQTNANEYEQFRVESIREYNSFRKKMYAQWGEFKYSTATKWVEYSTDCTSVATVDFEKTCHSLCALCYQKFQEIQP